MTAIPDPRSYLGEPLVEIVAYARPAGQGSKRHVGNGRMIEQSKYVKPFRDAITKAARDAVGDDWEPLDGPLTVALTFTIKRPQKPMWPEPATPFDVDKGIRSAFDALSPIYKGKQPNRITVWPGVWVDDSRVTRVVQAIKTYPSFSVPGALQSEGITMLIWKGAN